MKKGRSGLVNTHKKKLSVQRETRVSCCQPAAGTIGDFLKSSGVFVVNADVKR